MSVEDAEGAEELTYLQTASYQTVTVFIIFVGITLVIDGALCRAKKFLERHGTKGMMHAYFSLLMEFVFLGILSFLLEVIAVHVEKICIPMYEPQTVGYWWVRNNASINVFKFIAALL